MRAGLTLFRESTHILIVKLKLFLFISGFRRNSTPTRPVQAALRQRFRRSGIAQGHQNRPCPGWPPVLKICINMAYSKVPEVVMPRQNARTQLYHDQHRENLVGLHGRAAEWPYLYRGSVFDPQATSVFAAPARQGCVFSIRAAACTGVVGERCADNFDALRRSCAIKGLRKSARKD